MIRVFAVAGMAALALAGCQTPDPRYVHTDQDCLNRQVGSRVLSTAAGIGVGLVAGPLGGLVGLGLGVASDPRCQAYRLTPEGRAREAQEWELDRQRFRRTGDPFVRPTYAPPAGRPLDNIPGNSPIPLDAR
jgi:hypothetical protein